MTETGGEKLAGVGWMEGCVEWEESKGKEGMGLLLGGRRGGGE